MDNSERNRVEAEQGRVTAEEGRVMAEQGRAHAESNEGTGRVESEEARVIAEKLRQSNQELFQAELDKFSNDPEHYISPGARRILRRFTYAWVIVALAAILGVWALTEESNKRVNDIQESRIEITYDSCLDINDRNINTVSRIDKIIDARREKINEVIRNSTDPEEIKTLQGQLQGLSASRETTVSLVDALAPKRDCVAYIIDRFGEPPNLTEQGGE